MDFSTQEIVTLHVKVAMLMRRDLQADIAAALGLSTAAVSNRLNDHVEWSLSELDQLAKHFGCTVADLIDDEPGFLDRVELPASRARVSAKHFEAIEDPMYVERREQRKERARERARLSRERRAAAASVTRQYPSAIRHLALIEAA